MWHLICIDGDLMGRHIHALHREGNEQSQNRDGSWRFTPTTGREMSLKNQPRNVRVRVCPGMIYGLLFFADNAPYSRFRVHLRYNYTTQS